MTKLQLYNIRLNTVIYFRRLIPNNFQRYCVLLQNIAGGKTNEVDQIEKPRSDSQRPGV